MDLRYKSNSTYQKKRNKRNSDMCNVFGGHFGKKELKTFNSVRHPNHVIEQFF